MSGHRSFSDEDTHFRFLRSQTPVDRDGFKKGEFTGQVECEECGAWDWNIDEIPHDEDCPQRWVRSEWWVRHLRAEGNSD